MILWKDFVERSEPRRKLSEIFGEPGNGAPVARFVLNAIHAGKNARSTLVGRNLLRETSNRIETQGWSRFATRRQGDFNAVSKPRERDFDARC